MIQLTETAVAAVQKFINCSERNIVGVRVRIESGGCAGLRYGLKLEDHALSGDQFVEVSGLTMVIDPGSMEWVDGVTIDYVESLEATGFRFDNPNASHKCGCGRSFSC